MTRRKLTDPYDNEIAREQLSLDGSEPPPATTAERPLTPRQQHALDTITRAGTAGLTSDELGAIMHEYRREHGGRGHDRDTRCDYCVSEGRQVGDSLRARGLVWKAGNRDWTLVEHRDTKAERQVDGYDPRTSAWPEGF